MCEVGGRRTVGGFSGEMQRKTVSLMPPFNVCAVKADARFMFRSDETHLCSREQERGRNAMPPTLNIYHIYPKHV